MEALWGSFDAAVQAAEGKELRTGPRGGGRGWEGVIRHVLEAEIAYLQMLGGKLDREENSIGHVEGFALVRKAVLAALEPAVRSETPRVGPRGGKRWTPRFYVRYAAWHILVHTWDLEDRSQG